MVFFGRTKEKEIVTSFVTVVDISRREYIRREPSGEKEKEKELFFFYTHTYIVGGGRGQKRREHHEAAEKKTASSSSKMSSKSASHQIGVGRDDVRDSFSPKKRLRVERFWRRRDRLDETGSPKSDEQNDDDDHSPEERRRTEGKKRTKRGARR